jgi:hypothetical protein
MIQTEIGLNANPFKRGVQQAQAQMRGLTETAKVQSKLLEDQFKVINVFRAGAAAFGISAVRGFFQDAIDRAKELGDQAGEAGKAVQRLGEYSSQLKDTWRDVKVTGVGFLAGLGEIYGMAIAKLGNAIAPKMFASPEEVNRVKERQRDLDRLQKASEERKKQREKESQTAAAKEAQDARERQRMEAKLAELERRNAEIGKTDVQLLEASNKRLFALKNKATEEEASGAKATLETRVAIAEELLENANLLDRVSKEQLRDEKAKAKAGEAYAKSQQNARAAIAASAKERQKELAGLVKLTPKEEKELTSAEKKFEKEAAAERRRLDRQRRADEKREKELASMNPRDKAARLAIEEREEKMRAGLERGGTGAATTPLQDAAKGLMDARARADSITEQLGQNTGIGADTKIITEQLSELREIKKSLEAVATQNNEE